MFRDAKDLRILFRILVAAALLYGLLQLVEVALSPQLNNWVYGFFQHSWAQMKRGGGFRPIVFMSHALIVAMFTMIGLTAAATLYKAKIKVMGLAPVWPLLFLSLVAVLNKSVAALVYALIAVMLIIFTKPRTQFRVAAFLAVGVLLYPILRAVDLVPVESMRDFFGSLFNEERAGSLNTRFVHEHELLERALERPFFGWGGFGRSLIHDPRSGHSLTIADGEWIVTLGKYGIVGFVGKFSLLVVPIFAVARRTVPRPSDRTFLAALALIVAFSTADLIPNSTSHYLPFVFSGALFGCSTRLPLPRKKEPRRGWLRRMMSDIADMIAGG